MLAFRILTSVVHPSYFLPDDSAGRIARELWWMSQEFSPASIIILLGVSMFIYHMGDEQKVCWYLRFSDVVSPPSM
jgi:hypothetical protein